MVEIDEWDLFYKSKLWNELGVEVGIRIRIKNGVSIKLMTHGLEPFSK